MNKNTDLLTVKEASEYLGLSERTVQRLSKQGKIKGIKLGRQWKFFKEDIEKYLSLGIDFSAEPSRTPHFRESAGERRAYPRINTNFKCNYSVNLPPFKSITNSGIIKNISAGGVFLVIHDVGVSLDDPIDLTFSLNTEINPRGRVVRKGKSGVGIKFRNITTKDRNKIIQYIG